MEVVSPNWALGLSSFSSGRRNLLPHLIRSIRSSLVHLTRFVVLSGCSVLRSVVVP